MHTHDHACKLQAWADMVDDYAPQSVWWHGRRAMPNAQVRHMEADRYDAGRAACNTCTMCFADLQTQAGMMRTAKCVMARLQRDADGVRQAHAAVAVVIQVIGSRDAARQGARLRRHARLSGACSAAASNRGC
jgi:hypothetical protein